MLLVVDDEDLARRVTARMLRAAGFIVLTAATGAEALRLAENESVRLVVTDVVMPGMNGVELAERLHQSHSALPVVFMSGAIPQSQIRGLSGPFLQKPFSEEVLLREVRRFLPDD